MDSLDLPDFKRYLAVALKWQYIIDQVALPDSLKSLFRLVLINNGFSKSQDRG